MQDGLLCLNIQKSLPLATKDGTRFDQTKTVLGYTGSKING